MTKAQHTPGPWEGNSNGLIYGQCADDESEAPFVCDVINDSAMQALGIMSPVEEANARLIAAAPELLAALEAVEPLLSALYGSAQQQKAHCVRAAIAKAKGD